MPGISPGCPDGSLDDDDDDGDDDDGDDDYDGDDGAAIIFPQGAQMVPW